MTVYHGAVQEIREPELSYSRHNLDFGAGFYVTTLQEQAEKWAMRKSVAQGALAIVNMYDFDVTDLNILTFDGYTEEWLDFVLLNRIGGQAKSIHDAVFGNIADDDVAATVDEYIRLTSKGRIEPQDKQFFIRQLRFSKPNNQYCISSPKGIEALTFLSSYEVGRRPI